MQRSRASERGQSEWWARGQTWSKLDPDSSSSSSSRVRFTGRHAATPGPARFNVVLFEDVLVEHARRVLSRGPFTPPSKLAFEGDDPAARPFLALHALLDDPSADRLTLETARADRGAHVARWSDVGTNAEGDSAFLVGAAAPREGPASQPLPPSRSRSTRSRTTQGSDKFHRFCPRVS